MGIENNTEGNFKDLEEMLGNAKGLRRNNRECEGILIFPSMAPQFFGVHEIPSPVSFSPTALGARSASGPNFAARMASRQPDLRKKRESSSRGLLPLSGLLIRN